MGILWSGSAQLGTQLLSLLGTLVLARLLSPEAFGLLGMVTVFTGLIAVFQNLGLGPAIVQDRAVDEGQLSGLFWVNVLFSLLLMAIGVATAPLVARFYDQPEVLMIMVVLVVMFPVSAVSLVPDAVLTRDMDFRRLGLIDVGSQMLGLVAGVGLASLGFGVWALVWQQVTAATSRTLLKVLITPWRPAFVLPLRSIRSQLVFGIRVLGGSLLSYGTRNVDDLLIGRVLNASALGTYQMAYRLMLWPLQHVSQVVGSVMFPALAFIQDDTERVKRGFLRGVSMIALVTFPVMIGAWLVAPMAVPLLLGPQWAGVVPVFEILCPLGLVQSVATSTGWIFLSQGRADLRLKLQAFMSPLLILSFIVGLRWGIVGVAACYAAMSALLIPVQIRVAGGLIGMGMDDVVRALAGVLGYSLAAGGAAALVGWLVPAAFGVWLRLMAQVTCGVVVYVWLIHRSKLPAYVQLRELLAERVTAVSQRR